MSRIPKLVVKAEDAIYHGFNCGHPLEGPCQAQKIPMQKNRKMNNTIDFDDRNVKA